MKITKKLAQSIELLLKTAGYTVRLEKGNFKGGSCILESQKLVVINAFYPFESRVQAMIDVLNSVELDRELLDDSQLSLLDSLKSEDFKLVSTQ